MASVMWTVKKHNENQPDRNAARQTGTKGETNESGIDWEALCVFSEDGQDRQCFLFLWLFLIQIYTLNGNSQKCLPKLCCNISEKAMKHWWLDSEFLVSTLAVSAQTQSWATSQAVGCQAKVKTFEHYCVSKSLKAEISHSDFSLWSDSIVFVPL